MTLSKKTKSELIAEVKKLQRKIESVQKKKSNEPPVTLADLKGSTWESFFKNSLNRIIVIDKTGRILDINKVERRIKKENIVGKKVYDFVDKAAVKGMKLAIDNVFKTAKSQ